MVSGYDKRPPQPSYWPSGVLGWPFVAGGACALVLVMLLWTFG